MYVGFASGTRKNVNKKSNACMTQYNSSACSFGWWLMAGVDLF
jgi:hypothetical protein